VDLPGLNPPGNDDLPSLAVVGPQELRDCFGCRHLTVRLAVVPDPHRLIVTEAEINAADRATSASFEFTKPLVRDEEVPCDRYREKSPGSLTT
jgi:hypothetical protein